MLVDVDASLKPEMPEHVKLMKRLRKTLYYGGLQMTKCKMLSQPLCDLAAEVFTETHKDYSLYRLNYDIVGNVKATPCSLILAMIYLDLLKSADPNYVQIMSPSELFLVAMMISTKFYSGYDEEVYISEWAEYGNISVERMRVLEIEFLDAMDWKIYVSNEMFFKKLDEIEFILAQKQSTRGWLTYTELVTLMPCIDAIRKIIGYSTMIAVSYTAGVLAIASAFFIASQIPGSYLCRNQITVTQHSSSDPTNATAASPASLSPLKTDCSPLTTSCSENHSEIGSVDENSTENRILLLDWASLTFEVDVDGEESPANHHIRPLNHNPDPLNQVEIDSFFPIRKRNSTSLFPNLYLTNNDHGTHFLSFLWFKYL